MATESVSSLLTLLSRFWFESYTSPDTWWPFLVPFSFWTGCWIYAAFSKRRRSNNNAPLLAVLEYSKWYSLHTFHHVGAIVQASLSLYYNDDFIFNERISILWSMGYFLVDIVDCVVASTGHKKQHALYILHGVVCFSLGLCNYHIPLLRELRMNSRASYIEASSILLYQVKQSRKPWLFIAFAVVYTLCRIVWIPYGIMKKLIHHNLPWHSPIFLLLLAFYGLQIHWWIKILKILQKGSGDENDDGPKKQVRKEEQGVKYKKQEDNSNNINDQEQESKKNKVE